MSTNITHFIQKIKYPDDASLWVFKSSDQLQYALKKENVYQHKESFYYKKQTQISHSKNFLTCANWMHTAIWFIYNIKSAFCIYY